MGGLGWVCLASVIGVSLWSRWVGWWVCGRGGLDGVEVSG